MPAALLAITKIITTQNAVMVVSHAKINTQIVLKLSRWNSNARERILPQDAVSLVKKLRKVVPREQMENHVLIIMVIADHTLSDMIALHKNSKPVMVSCY